MIYKIKSILPKPILEILRNIKGTYIAHLKKSFNTYTRIERKKSVIPTKFNWSTPTPLCYIMKDKGTDKALYQGQSKHNYTTFYYAVFKQFKNKDIRLFEMGIGTTDPNITHNMGALGTPGASIRGWKEFFPLGQIFAADIDTRILFEEDRIKTFFVDQLDAATIKSMWLNNHELSSNFDVIIDDGLHTFEANTCFFENSYNKLKPGGIYIVEDVESGIIIKWEQIIKEVYSKKYLDLRFIILKVPNPYNYFDNNLIVIEKIR